MTKYETKNIVVTQEFSGEVYREPNVNIDVHN